MNAQTIQGLIQNFHQLAYALNSVDCDDRRVSRDTLVRLPSTYNYYFLAFSGATITQLALSS